jgi:DNA-binding MarR family transcriptional regulator
LIQRLLHGPATATEIAGDLGVSQQAVSKAVNELIRLGHVETIADPADRRRRPVQLTVRGRDAVATARAARAGIDDRLREELGDERFDAVRAGLLAALEALDLGDAVRRRAVSPAPGMLA